MSKARSREDLSQIMLRPDGICAAYSMGRTKADTLLKEMEEWIPKRYPRMSLIRDGGLTLVNRLAFIDYLSNRQLLKGSATAKYAKPYDPAGIAAQLAYISIYNGKENAS